jgi:hypothetical protein
MRPALATVANPAPSLTGPKFDYADATAPEGVFCFGRSHIHDDVRKNG